MYSWSPNLSQISLKNSFGKVFFLILAEIEMTRNESRLFGRHFETVQIFYIFFSWNMIVISVYTYGVKIIKKFRWESGFLWGGSMEPPFCTNGSAGYFMQLSVKNLKLFSIWIIIWAYSFVKKSRRVFSILLRNQSFSNARWFYD